MSFVVVRFSPLACSYTLILLLSTEFPCNFKVSIKKFFKKLLVGEETWRGVCNADLSVSGGCHYQVVVFFGFFWGGLGGAWGGG